MWTGREHGWTLVAVLNGSSVLTFFFIVGSWGCRRVFLLYFGFQGMLSSDALPKRTLSNHK